MKAGAKRPADGDATAGEAPAKRVKTEDAAPEVSLSAFQRFISAFRPFISAFSLSASQPFMSAFQPPSPCTDDRSQPLAAVRTPPRALSS